MRVEPHAVRVAFEEQAGVLDGAVVEQQLRTGGADPALRQAEGGAILAQTTTREANVLAFNDVFRLVALVAAATAAYLMFLLGRRHWRARKTVP